MADSLLAALEELNEQELRTNSYASDAVLVIDNDLRTIAVPSNFIFGVYNDKNVLSVNFEMPRTYDDVDLSGFTIQINYLAPNKVGNVYEVTDPVVGEDKITFEWLLDRGVFLSSGTVEFTVCLREIGQEGAVIREFNTTIAKGTVLAGLEIEDPEDPEAYSLIAHIKQMDERVTYQAGVVASDYAKTARIADDVEAIAEELADDVAEVKEKYGTPLVAATAAGMTDHTKIYVYTGSETGYTFGNWYYYDGSAWASGGVYNSAGINTDATLSVSGMAADAKKTGDEISGLKEDIMQLPRVDGSDATGVDLDISDDDGNVILRLADGHIKTKNFDSSSIDVGDVPLIDRSDATNVDLDITDKYGNVVVRFKDGHVFTKKFSSTDIEDIENAVDELETIIETFSKKIVYDSSATNTITINHGYKKGDEIWFHLNDSQEFWNYGRYATYYEGSKVVASNRRGSNGYFRHVITADCDSVGVTIASGEYTNGTELTLDVYRIIGEVKPKIVTVKSDGTGMYTTIKAAVDSITDANHLTNPYVIEVYPGTYNTLDGYTDEEIASAGDVEHYTQTSMVGVKLTDGMSMRGIGDPDEIILTADLDPNDWDFSVRGEISTLNIQGEGFLENMTIIGKNIRYCVHDDFRAPVNSLDKRVLRNLIFKGERLSYYPFMTTFGGGMSQPRDYLIENCDFGYDLGIHSNSGYAYGCTIEVNNCSGCRFRLGDVAESGDATNHVIVNNCNFQVIKTTHDSNSIPTHMILTGTGCEQSMIKDAVAGLYRLGMVDLFPTGLTTGTLVKRASTGLAVEATSNKDVAYGVVIGSDGDYSYVQRTGYIASNYLSLTGLAVGDYVTVDSTTHLIITGGTSANAVGVVDSVDSDGYAYIKLLI